MDVGCVGGGKIEKRNRPPFFPKSLPLSRDRAIVRDLGMVHEGPFFRYGRERAAAATLTYYSNNVRENEVYIPWEILLPQALDTKSRPSQIGSAIISIGHMHIASITRSPHFTSSILILL
jgi:hypothetical protein